VPRVPHHESSSRGLKILIAVLAIGLVAAVAVLLQTRSRLARVTAGVQSPARPGASAPASASAAAPAPSESAAAAPRSARSAPPAGGADRTGSAGAVARAATFPPGASGAPVPATEGFLSAGRPGVDYTAAYVVDRGTGRVLYEYNAHTPVPTASMAKMMTSLITMNEIEAGRLSLDDSVTISAHAAGMGGSQIYAAQGQVFSVRTLLAATMVQSANDAAMALAEKIAGSSDAFAERMNRRARELGLEGSTFYDPHGLPNPGRENVMTARDLAVVGNELLRYPLMREYAAAPTLPFQNATFTAGLTNPNFLLRQYEGAYGIKTGYTASAGFSVTAAARRDGTDVIAVLTGAKSSRGRQSSFALAGRLMDEAFRSWTTVVPVRQGDAAGEVPVERGAARTVGAVAGRDAAALVPRGESKVQWTLEARRIEAPVAKGDTVGTIVVRQGAAEVARVPALAAAAVERRPWWRFWGG
jgi:D-alanyl-D-alanine carboxypeptidase (penicillin-binding protein 5/6)